MGTVARKTCSHSTEYFTPYQLVIATFTVLYAFRHLDDLLGIAGETVASSLLTFSARSNDGNGNPFVCD